MCLHVQYVCLRVCAWMLRSKVDTDIFFSLSVLFFETGSLTESRGGQTALHPTLFFQVQGLQTSTPMPDFYIGARDLSLGPHMYLASMSLAVSLPQSLGITHHLIQGGISKVSKDDQIDCAFLEEINAQAIGQINFE